MNKETIEFKENIIPQLPELLALYRAVDWQNYTKNPQMLEQAWRNSLFTLTIWQNNHLIGAIRVVGDGFSLIYIQDLLIFPDFQRQGLDKLLLDKVLEKYPQVYMRLLMTDDSPAVRAFYENCGWKDLSRYHSVCFGR